MSLRNGVLLFHAKILHVPDSVKKKHGIVNEREQLFSTLGSDFNMLRLSLACKI